MRKMLSVLFALFIIPITSAQDFTVNRYVADIYISEKGYFDVVENYDLNFEIEKHGIYRTIQTSYDLINSKGEAEKRKIKISHIEVPNYKFEAPFDFVQKLSDWLEIKIGDKDITLTGPQHYEIRYRVHNAFLFEDSQIRFYWNIKPSDWSANFNKIRFRVHVPEGIALSEENCFVYSGESGNTSKSGDIDLAFEKNVLSGAGKENFISYPGQSVTVLINLPPGSVKEVKPLWPFWNDYGWTFFVGLLVAGFYAVWKKYGKDDQVISSTSYYPPKQIDPAMAGFLINDREDSSDIISLLPYWGAGGYLRIEEIKKKGLFGNSDTKLIRLKNLPENARPYEKIIFNGLFSDSKDAGGDEVLVSSLKNTFYTKMSSARSELKESAQTYYEAASRKAHVITMVVLILLAILLSIIGLFFWGPLAAIVLGLTCLVLLLFNIFMVKRNARGNDILSELKGFRRFIKVAEENKLKMLLKEDPGYFETTMAYALAFGLFDKWAKKFDALNLAPPAWYATANPGSYNIHNFSKSFSGAVAGMSTTMVSSPSSSGSSGGGSSGGGFGGGGGGSW